MSNSLFAYPVAAKFGKVLPKAKIYEYSGANTRLKDLFVEQVEQIIWQYKLAPETINLPARPGVPEIQIFSIQLKSSETGGTDSMSRETREPHEINQNTTGLVSRGTVLFAEESYAIQGAVFEVYREMGCGFLEAIYQECLEKEFRSRLMPFEAQRELVLSYKGERLTQSY